MKLKVVPCYSYFHQMALEQIQFQKNPYDNKLICLEELNKREICLSKELILEIIKKSTEKFSNNLQMAEMIINLFDPLIRYAGLFTPIVIEDKEKLIDELDDEYEREIMNVANNTNDKIILSDIIEEKKELSQINIIKTNNIKDRKNENILNSYRLPIIKNIRKGDNSYKIGKWLERFFYDSKKIIIVDPYFYYNIKNSIKYLLDYLGSTVEINIYMKKGKLITGSKNIISQDIRQGLQKFSKINIYIFDDEEQHDRFILTEDYYLYLGKGLQVLGNKKTHQSEIRINRIEDIEIVIPKIIEIW